MEAIILVGIPASGKTEFYIRNFFKTHVRINLDMLKTRKKESIIFEACIKAKQPFVIDNTNPTVKDRAKYIEKAKSAGFKVICYYFESTLGNAIIRNNRRTGIEKVPQVAIRSILGRLEIPDFNEGFDELYYARITDNRRFTIEKQIEN